MKLADWLGLDHMLKPGCGASPPNYRVCGGKVEKLLLEGEGMGANAIEVFYIDLPRYNLFG